LSWRVIGALLMVHGDDSGLILPPKVAPIQIVVVPIQGKAKDEQAVIDAVAQVRGILGERFRIEVDNSDKTPGWKYSEWEMRGVPLRVEVGPRDARANQAMLVRRDTREKQPVPVSELADTAGRLLEAIQANLYQRALESQQAHLASANTMEEFRRILREQPGFILSHWCGDPECEARVKAETGATIRCIPFTEGESEGVCIYDGKPSTQRVLFARAY
jgi:prolyl-tRNA synthetase